MSLSQRYSHVGAAIDAVLTSPLGGSTSDLTLNCSALTGWPTGASSRPFFIVVDRDMATEEKMLCSARVGNVLTVFDDGLTNGRAADNTAISAHGVNATVEHVFTALEADQANAHLTASAGVHNLTGAVVGTTDTQVLTGKTMDGDLNTFLDIPQASVATLPADLAAKVAKSLLTTKGDLIVASVSAVPMRLPIGVDDTVVAADSTAASGLAYVTPMGRFITRTTVSAASGMGQNIDTIFLAKWDVIVGKYRWATAASTANIKATLRVAGVASGVHYYDSEGQSDAAFFVIGKANVAEAVGEFRLYNVADAQFTGLYGDYANAIGAAPAVGQIGGSHQVATAYDGIHIDPSTSTLTGFIDWYGWGH